MIKTHELGTTSSRNGKGSDQTSAVTLARVGAGSRCADHVAGYGYGRRVSRTATFSICHPEMKS